LKEKNALRELSPEFLGDLRDIGGVCVGGLKRKKNC